jgi:N utilization substance protein A
MDKKVVKKVANKATQISLNKAQKLESKLRENDHVEINVTQQADFGRVAAQAAKQVILQSLREAEKETQIKKYVDHIGEIETGVIQRIEGNTVFWEIGRAIGIMPLEERISTEFYKSGQRHRILLKEIAETTRGRSIIVTRSDPKFLEALFDLEIPELQSGTIDIKGVAREAGQRSKVAVFSNVDGIDPIGSCVGQRGIRIMAVMNELKMGTSEEKIDIILWDEDPVQYVVNSLSPAEVISTKIIDKEKSIIQVVVPDEQLSLAIGREGQNVRLAAKLTGWNIDIQGKTVKVKSEYADLSEDEEAKKDKKDKKDKKVTKKKATSKKTKTKSKAKSTVKKASALEKLGLSTRVVTSLSKAGIRTLKDLKVAVKTGDKIAGIGAKSMEDIESVI